MFPLIAGSGALSYLTSLLQSSTASVGGSSGSDPMLALEQTLTGAAQGAGQTTTSASTNSAGSASPFDPGMLSALLSLQGQVGGASGQGSLFSQMDTNGDGSISENEFENALGAVGVDKSSADALFNKLDSNGDGSISKSELSSAHHGHGNHHHVGGGSGQSGSSSLLNATNADGSTTQTTMNQDGSTTTTITYADGSTVSTTTPAAQNGGTSNGGSGSPSQSNLLEQLIQMQSQFIAQSQPGLSTLV